MNFFFAIATTMGMTLLPLLATENLGLSITNLGYIEGTAEFISNVLRLISGNLFDRMKNRKLLFIIPATLAFASKLIFFIPYSLCLILAKIMERISNGAFAVPRDAYVGENTKKKGIALGLLSFSKGLGCIIGPLIISVSTLKLGTLKENIYVVIALAGFVNFITFLLSFRVSTKKKITILNESKVSFTELKEVFKHLRLLFILSFLFFLGRFNDGVLILHLKNQGFPEWFYLATISFFNLAMVIVSPIIGLWNDKKKSYQVLFFTIAMLFAFNIFFYNVSLNPWLFACLGLTCWGCQRVSAQITFSAIIFKKAPVKYYGTTIGAYSLLSGAGVFVASIISGHLAQISFNYAFLFSGTISLFALAFAFYMFKRDFF
jgi:MFS family permease